MIHRPLTGPEEGNGMDLNRQPIEVEIDELKLESDEEHDCVSEVL